MRWLFVSLVFSLLVFTGGAAVAGMTPDIAAQQDPHTPTLSSVQIHGNVSPPMWEFTRGDKRILVLGTQYPLRKDTAFYSGMIEQYASQADAMLGPPGLVADDSVSLWRGIMLWTAARRAQVNPGGKSLKEVLSPQTYSRWEALKLKYIGRKSSVERLRPMYAAFKLYTAAIKKTDMRNDSRVYPIVERVVERKKAEVADGRFHLAVNPTKTTAKAFEVSAQEDVTCLEQTLDQLEPFLENAPLAADAWAAGDVVLYGEIVARYKPPKACWARLTNEAFGRLDGVVDPYGQVDASWMGALYRLFATKDVIITLLPARDILSSSGVVSTLIAQEWSITPLFAKQDTTASSSADVEFGSVPVTNP